MKEVNPKETTRAYAFEMWMDAPMPMLTFSKTIDVINLLRVSKKKGSPANIQANIQEKNSISVPQRIASSRIFSNFAFVVGLYTF